MQIATKERPILFSGPMVRAILEGRKAQTRRIIKPQPPVHINELHGGFRGGLSKRAPYDIEDDEQRVCGWGFQDDCDGFYRFTYGKIGDRLRISEEVTVKPVCEDWYSVYFHADGSLLKRACDPGLMEKIKGYKSGRLRGVHLPPAYARDVTLEITGVRVERLVDISNADCIAEGIEAIGEPRKLTSGHEAQAGRLDSRYSTVRQLFSELWQSINGPDSWAANPWVFVIEFRRLQ